jgi:adenosylcobinamide-phosphate synthase
MRAFAIALAYLLDLSIKDPQVWWHPVRLIGGFIAVQEKYYRKVLRNDLTGGLLLASVTALSVLAISITAVWMAAQFSWMAAFMLDAVLIYFSISPSALAQEGKAIHRHLASGDLDAARKALSMIVGRDTATLDQPAIIRAAVETISENSVDALVSPLFYAAIGGGPLAMAYRAVNTCDSMVGYRNEKYEQFGKIPARLDDVANFIPARLALAFIPVSAFLCGMDGERAFSVGLRDRLKHQSPNSAHGEAVFAGALGVRLGGPSVYGGVIKVKPWIGDANREIGGDDILNAVRLLNATAVVAVIVFTIVRYIWVCKL